VSHRHLWRRGDGTVFGCRDLTEAVPFHLDELDDIKDLVGQVEEWLLYDEVACDLFTDWLIAVDCGPGTEPSAREVVKALGELGVKLHRIVKAGLPKTGHAHPPTP
jgi:hypothetical protein